MRYRMNIGEDRVDHLIGQCLQNSKDAERLFDTLISKNLRKVDLITGSVHLSAAEHVEFAARFSAEVEPTIWESSFRKQ